VHIYNARRPPRHDHLYRLGHRRIGIHTGPLVSPSAAIACAAPRFARKQKAERDFVVMNGDFSSSPGGRRRAAARTPQPPGNFLLTTNAMGANRNGERAGCACRSICRSSVFDDIRFRRCVDRR